MYHIPVLLEESLRELDISPDGVYVDLTFGGGGHAKSILEKLSDRGHLFAFDQDADAIKNAEKIDAPNFTFFKSNSCYLKYFFNFLGSMQVDGIFADLGISSHQIDTAERGFSTRYNGPLDMRMNQTLQLAASIVVNKYSEKRLQNVLSAYGEISNASALASAVIKQRLISPINTTEQLCEIIAKFTPANKLNKYSAQVFQALRIEVNQELEVLQTMLMQTPNILKKDGRLVVISYHSLEDRLVKRFMSTGNFTTDLEKDIYGNVSRPLEPLHKKPIEASEEEIITNTRSRSAKLRVAIKK